MKVSKLSIGVLFLLSSTTIFYAQQTPQDTIRKEKQIEGVTITGSRNKGNENAIISQQRKSVEVIERVGSVQLEKQGVGDVSVAVTKATGTQKQESSGQIFVRGLGDRSNATTINGLPVPSDDPIYKNLDLSILKTDMIDYVGMEKVYNPRLWGDMSGANVNIATKIYTGRPYFKIGLGSSVNLNAVQKNHFYLQDGPNYFGYKKVNKPTNNNLVNVGFPITTSSKDQEVDNPINSSLSLEFGTKLDIGSGRLSIFGYGSFDNGYSYQEGITGGAFKADNSTLKVYDDSREYEYNTNTSGLLNLNYKFNSNHNLNFSSNYIHTTDQELGYYNGYDRDYWDLDPNQDRYVTNIRRATYKTNDLFANQLRGDHQISEKLQLGWNAGFNYLDSRRPDRQQNASIYDKDLNSSFFASSNPGANHRYYDRLEEKDYVGDLFAEYQFNEKGKVTLGYSGRFRDDVFKSYQYNFRVKNPGTTFVDPNNYDLTFNYNNYLADVFDVATFYGDISIFGADALQPEFFTSEVFNNAGYLNVEYKLTEKFTGQLGVRYDNLSQDMNFKTAIIPNGGKVTKDYSKILPALNLKYALNDKNNLRLSASKTYTTPLLLETAPFSYNDIGETRIGNKDIYPSDNYNLDLKWEWFPNRSELVSVTAFGKYIQNPISAMVMSSSANDISFANVGETGRVFGFEMEFRKDLYELDNTRFYTFLNGSYLNTEQELDIEKVNQENELVKAAFNKDKEELQGASNFLANVNLGWEQKWDRNTLDMVVSYSYFSDNIYALGFENRGNLIDKSFNTLDAILRLNFESGLGINFSGKNLLNPNITRIQYNETTTGDELVVREFKRGINLGAGVSYKF